MLWTVLIVLAALVVLPVLIGLAMPVRYEGRTDVEFDRDVQAVWDALQDYDAHPMTGRMMKSTEALPEVDGRPHWKEDMGRGEVITVTTTVFEPPRHMTREMSSTSASMTSRWDYSIEPSTTGTRVSLTGTTDIEGGGLISPIFRVMMVVGGGVKKGLDIQMDMVAATLGTTPRR